MIRVLLADDHAMFREGIRQILDETIDIKVMDEAESTTEVLKKMADQTIDVLVLDISMPGRDGIDILHDLKRHYPKTKVLILSMHPEEQYAVRAVKAGVAGYIRKNKAGQELIKAIRQVALGRKHISPEVAEQLAIELERGSTKFPHESLSNREFEVMCMIASGKTVSQIAEELVLSISTISTYRARILEKMNMKNNAELTYYAVKHDLIA